MATKKWQIMETKTIELSHDECGHKRVNNYVVLEQLGEGTFSKVKKCLRVDPNRPSAAKRFFALKILAKKQLSRMKDYVKVADKPQMKIVTALEKVEREIQILRTLYHPNVVLLFEVLQNDQHDKIYLVLEFMSKGPCMTYNAHEETFQSPLTHSRLTEALARQHLIDIVKGCQYLHNQGIYHRDLKPENILLNEANRCHISDFGSAHFDPVNATTLRSDSVGTYQFFAPEACCGEPYCLIGADIWAIGVCLYVFIYGTLPFTGATSKLLFDNIMSQPVVFPVQETEDVSMDCRDLISRILTKNPTERLSLKQILQHSWMLVEELETSS